LQELDASRHLAGRVEGIFVADERTTRVEDSRLVERLAGAIELRRTVGVDDRVVAAIVVLEVVAELRPERVRLLVDEVITDAGVDVRAHVEALELVAAPLAAEEQREVAEEPVVAHQRLDVRDRSLEIRRRRRGRPRIVRGEDLLELVVITAQAELLGAGEREQVRVATGLQAASRE
jgi:hypothetical protein